ncbi:MAG: UbiD family decarboxylase [Candidatus Binatia bacterium]
MKLDRRQTAKRRKEPVRIAKRSRAAGSALGSGAAVDLRAALEISDSLGELLRIGREVDPLIEVPGVLRAAAALRPIPAVVFENVRGYPGRRVAGNLFAEHRRFALMCGFADKQELTKASFLAALDQPIAPVIVRSAPCRENILTGPAAVEKHIPPTHGALKVQRKYYQMVVCLKHPKTGVINVALNRSCIQTDGRISINIQWEQHGGLILKEAVEMGKPLPVALCIGVSPAVYLAAVSKLPYGVSEIEFAGGILGRPVEMVKCKTVDLEVPAASEFVVEGEIRPPYARGADGPWPEYLGYLGMEIHPPIVDVTCLTHRNDPVENLIIPGLSPHMLGMGTQAQFFRFLRSIFGEFIADTHLLPRTNGHVAIVKVRKSELHHEGLQMNVALSAFACLFYLDKVVMVDEDINIYDLLEVEWACATRCDPADQLHVLPKAKTNRVNPIAGIHESEGEPITKAKLVIDATIPWKMRNVKKGDNISFFTRSEWPKLDLAEYLEPDDRARFLARK